MPLKALFYSIGCLVAWFVLLPVLVLAGGAVLFVYAISAELAALVTGKTGNSLEIPAAREIAHRMSSVYGVKARANRRHPFQ